MRWESHAYGTREEIIKLAANNLNAARSERRQQEARDAIEQLEAGAESVHFGKTTYHVESETTSSERVTE